MAKCKKCSIELVEGKTWYPFHIKANYRICKECHKANARKWQKDNPERHTATVRKWQKKHNYAQCQSPEYQRRWYQEHLEQARANGRERYHRRQARIANLPHTLTEAQWQEILEKYDCACAYCGRADLPLEQEHVVPISKGGGYTAENIVPACMPCNKRKGTKTAEEFLARGINKKSPAACLLGCRLAQA